ncbi:uncharacterized protein [Eurosta solidaginis]|uniref:uncharacterized protein n=1 Tax=Eurosta solidaginis TaxID=178769 RepID=UPI00353147BA
MLTRSRYMSLLMGVWLIIHQMPSNSAQAPYDTKVDLGKILNLSASKESIERQKLVQSIRAEIENGLEKVAKLENVLYKLEKLDDTAKERKEIRNRALSGNPKSIGFQIEANDRTEDTTEVPFVGTTAKMTVTKEKGAKRVPGITKKPNAEDALDLLYTSDEPDISETYDDSINSIKERDIPSEFDDAAEEEEVENYTEQPAVEKRTENAQNLVKTLLEKLRYFIQSRIARDRFQLEKFFKQIESEHPDVLYIFKTFASVVSYKNPNEYDILSLFERIAKDKTPNALRLLANFLHATPPAGMQTEQKQIPGGTVAAAPIKGSEESDESAHLFGTQNYPRSLSEYFNVVIPHLLRKGNVF